MSDKRQLHIDGLRRIADLLEQNEDLPLPDMSNISTWIYGGSQKVLEKMRAVARSVKSVEKHNNTGTFYLTHQVNSEVQLIFYAGSEICERKKAGTRVIPAQPARAATLERVEDKYEWKCPQLLAPTEQV